ncbi:MAG: hypothetical protein A2Z04_05880, partial [Chloroflexi bacterium RBG_16_57_9]
MRLMRAAQKHSDDMAEKNFLSHTGSDGSSPWDRIKRENYPLLSGGETVAGGQQPPADVVTAWLGSKPHREILMGQYRDIGAGYAFRAGTDYGYYWTIDVGVSSDDGQRPLPSPTPTAPKPPPCPTATPTPYVPPTRTPIPTRTPTQVNPPVPTATSTTPSNTVTLVVTPEANTAGWTMNGEAGNHFDDDDLYSGAYGGRLYLSGIQFDLSRLPVGAQILSAQVELTGQTAEYILSDPPEGWKLQVLSRAADDNWPSHNYNDLRNATVLATIPPTLTKSNVGTGTVDTFAFEAAQLGELVGRAKLSFRIDGPTSGNAVMSWDTGYGQDSRYSGPKLSIVYVPSDNNPTQTPVASKTWTPVPLPTSTPNPGLTDQEQRTIDLINQRRAGLGLPVLRVDMALVTAARAHSRDLSEHGLCEHIGSDGSTPWDRVQRAGYTGRAVGEVVGCGYDTPEGVVNAWFNSDGHRAILTDPNVNEIGIGWWGTNCQNYRQTGLTGWRDGGTTPTPPTN